MHERVERNHKCEASCVLAAVVNASEEKGEWCIFGEGCSARNKGRKGRAMSDMLPAVSRRTFVKATGALGALAAAGGTMAASQAVFSNVEPAHADTPEKLVWSQCNVNCGGRCIFHWHTKDGKIQYMTTDDIGNDDFQARACLRGRVMRQWVNNPDRLQYPMKRVGARGEGKFERIS